MDPRFSTSARGLRASPQGAIHLGVVTGNGTTTGKGAEILCEGKVYPKGCDLISRVNSTYRQDRSDKRFSFIKVYQILAP